jgi:hypothetical protein
MSDSDSDMIVHLGRANAADTAEFAGLTDFTEQICQMCIHRDRLHSPFLTQEDHRVIDQRLKMLMKLGQITDIEVNNLRALLNREVCFLVSQFTKEVLSDQMGSNIRDVTARVKLREDEVAEMIITSYGDDSCHLERHVRSKLFSAIFNKDFPVIRDYLEKSRRVAEPFNEQ